MTTETTSVCSSVISVITLTATNTTDHLMSSLRAIAATETSALTAKQRLKSVRIDDAISASKSAMKMKSVTAQTTVETTVGAMIAAPQIMKTAKRKAKARTKANFWSE